jgi:hypothetical protein
MEIFEKFPDQGKDPVKPRGIGLRESEWQLLELIGNEFDETVNAIAVWALRDFIKRYQKGELPVIRVTKTSLPDL